MQGIVTIGNQRHLAQATRCGCCSKSSADHRVFIGFLEYDRQLRPATGQTAGAGWYNWLSHVLANHPVIHVQIFFVVDDSVFLSYSADKANGVACFTAPRGIVGSWRFIELRVSERQELAMRNFYASQVRKPFSFWGTFWLYTPFPRRTTGYEWFCSELCVTAMQRAGFLHEWRDAWTVKPHELYLHLANEFTEATRIMCTANPALFNLQTNTGTLNFDFGIRDADVASLEEGRRQ